MSLPNSSKRKVFDGRYEILSIVGRGVDSVVYHGRHITGSNQEVAIKVLVNRDGSTTLTDKLRREALTLVSCRHRYVVRLDDFHSIQDLCYLAMEYAPQGDLNKYIASLPNKRLAPDQVEKFLRQALEAIDFVHATGVIHRDLKPENILVLNDDEIRLADFGLSLLPGDDVPVAELRNAVGSFDYLAPEVLDGIRYDTVSDLYSLGVCFYEVASGKHPFSQAPIAEKRDARQDARITPISQLIPELPPHVAGVIRSLMLFSATDRFQTASDALRALDNKGFKGLVSSSAPTSIIGEVAINDIATKSAPANSDISDAPRDVAVAEPTKRPEQTPTETIDLQKIKEIINNDTATRSSTAPNQQSDLPTAEQSAHKNDSVRDERTVKASNTQAPIQRKAKPNPSSLNLEGPSQSPLPRSLVKYLGVAVAFAILTVGGVSAYSSIFSGKAVKPDQSASSDGQTRTGAAIESGADAKSTQESSESAEPAPSIMALPSGIYTGSISGIFSDSATPMAIISNPESRELTLMLGLDGWLPSTVSTEAAEDKDPNSPTFRSNGLILRFNQESSSSKITGTVIDVVTGEAGTWRVAK